MIDSIENLSYSKERTKRNQFQGEVTMEKVVWKYELQPKQENKIEMPVGAEVLHIDCQNNKPHLWALVPTDTDKEERTFYIIPTGEPFVAKGKEHLGTTLQGRCESGLTLVWHIFKDSSE